MRLVEIAAEPRRAAFEIATRAPSRELLEEVLDEVLLRELLDDLNLLDADGDLARDCPAELDPGAALGNEKADELAARDERDGEAGAATAARELRSELREAERRPRAARLGIARLEVEFLAGRVEQIDVAGTRGEEWTSVRDDGLQELVEPLRPCDLLRELGQLLELDDPQARLLVQARVLDCARHERRRRDDEVDLGVGELARCLGVRGDRSDRVPRAADDGHREERLEPLLLELGDILHPRIRERVVADERRLAVLHGPPGEAVGPVEHDLPGMLLVRRRSRAKDEPRVVLEEVDEACLDAARVGHEPNDRGQHLRELDRRRDRRHDLLQELLARLQGHRAGSYDVESLWTN